MKRQEKKISRDLFYLVKSSRLQELTEAYVEVPAFLDRDISSSIAVDQLHTADTDYEIQGSGYFGFHGCYLPRLMQMQKPEF